MDGWMDGLVTRTNSIDALVVITISSNKNKSNNDAIESLKQIKNEGIRN